MKESNLTQEMYENLTTLQEFVPMDTVPQEFVYTFHGILDELEKSGGNLSQYRVSDSAIQPSPQTTEPIYDGVIFQKKVAALLRQFIVSKDNGNSEVIFVFPDSKSCSSSRRDACPSP